MMDNLIGFGFVGTSKRMQSYDNDFEYELGEVYESEDVDPVERIGFTIELASPLNQTFYYPNTHSRYFLVEYGGEIKRLDSTRIVASKVKIVKEFNILKWIKKELKSTNADLYRKLNWTDIVRCLYFDEELYTMLRDDIRGVKPKFIKPFSDEFIEDNLSYLPQGMLLTSKPLTRELLLLIKNRVNWNSLWYTLPMDHQIITDHKEILTKMGYNELAHKVRNTKYKKARNEFNHE